MEMATKQPLENQKKIIPKNKQIPLNKMGDVVVINPEKENPIKEAAVLSIQQRIKRSIQLRHRLAKIKKARELARKRMASNKKIGKRSKSLARKLTKRKFAGKKSYNSLSTAGKIAIDRVVNSKQAAIKRLAVKLLPKVRGAERVRLRTGAAASVYESTNPMINFISRKYDVLIEKTVAQNKTINNGKRQ